MVLTTAVLLSACTIPGVSQSTPTPLPSTAPPEELIEPQTVPTLAPGSSPADATFLIEGQPVQLSDGKAQEPIPGSSTIVTTEIFGEPTMGDLNGDNYPDSAVILVQSPGGSGTFFYVAATLAQADGTYQGTNAVFVGDRISPQTTNIMDQTIVFNYATKPDGAPESAQNTEGRSGYYQVEGKVLKEVPAPNL